MNERHNNSSNGFLLGVIVGVLLTLLFVTKKGRRILRMLTEEGIDRFEDLEKVLREKMVDIEDDFSEDEIVGNDFVSHEPLPVPVVASHVSPVHRQYETHNGEQHTSANHHGVHHVPHEYQNHHEAQHDHINTHVGHPLEHELQNHSESSHANNHLHHENSHHEPNHTNHHEQATHMLGGQQALHRVKPSPRRFFKGVPRRS